LCNCRCVSRPEPARSMFAVAGCTLSMNGSPAVHAATRRRHSFRSLPALRRASVWPS
jgi:hypothetical protein